MVSVRKAILLAASVSLVGLTPGYAADSSSGSDGGVDAAASARLETLLSTIEQQNEKLQQQQADLEKQRAELEKQKAELLHLMSSIKGAASAGAARPASASAGAASPARQTIKTSAAAPASKPVAQAATDDSIIPGISRGEIVGSSAMNDASISAPGTTTVAQDERAPARMHTLKDLVRSAIAPTLSGQSDATSSPREVGERPEDKTPGLDIAVLADRGGVLTPKGTLVVTPEIEFSHSSVNRFFFDGVEIVEAVLIGDFLARDVSRDSGTATLGVRYGATSRLEFDAQVPYLYRKDRTVNQALTPNIPNAIIALEGDGLGDVEFGAHYQINKPKGPFPYFVAGLRAKSTTGKGPFDVPYDLQLGLPAKLPTGSGFWTIEPSVTMIYPSDPVVLFANVGYQYNFEKDVNKLTLDQFTAPDAATNTQRETITNVGRVSPGGTLDVSLGMGIGLNDAVSISFGYQHSWVLGTESFQTTNVYLHDTTGATPPTLDSSTAGIVHSQDAQLGSLLMGASIAMANHVGLNFNVAVGVTDEAPDVTINFRTPLTFRILK